MSHGATLFKKTSIALGIVTLVSAEFVSAASWSSGDWSVSFDSNFSLGTSIRTEARDASLVGNSNQSAFNWTGYNAATTSPLYTQAEVWAQSDGAYSTNGDLGNLNFDKNQTISTLFKGVHELDLKYQDMGIFLRGMYFYDFELKDKTRDWQNPITAQSQDPCKSPSASDELCSDIRLLDAFFYSDFYLGDVPVSLRIGQQVISWGESTFIQHGINTINPVDVSRALAPGAELKEVFIPIGTVFASFGLTDELSLSVYYQYEWQRSRLPQAGSYFATNDFAGEGGQNSNIQLGFSGYPDINLDFVLASLNGLGDALRLGADPSLIAQAYLAYPTKLALRGYSDSAHDDADDDGQYGIKLSYFAEHMNETEFGLYLINYHSQRPLLSGVTSNFTAAAIGADLGYIAGQELTKDNVTDLQAFTKTQFVYPEDIKLYGLSFNTNLGDTALAGEIAYRVDEPLQIDDVELLYAAMGQQLTLAGIRPGLDGISQLDNYLGYVVGPGETAQGYITSDTLQVQATATHIFGPVLGTDNLVLLAELGYVNIEDFPDPNLIRLNGPGTARSPSLQPTAEGDPRAALHIGLSNGPEFNPFPTDSAWGYRLLANVTFNNVFAGININNRFTFAHDVNGITPDPMFLFVEGRKSASASVTFDYLNKWSATASYNAFWGGVGTTNALSDRDFVAFNLKYSI